MKCVREVEDGDLRALFKFILATELRLVLLYYDLHGLLPPDHHPPEDGDHKGARTSLTMAIVYPTGKPSERGIRSRCLSEVLES